MLFDTHARIPAAAFGINGGEKSLIFADRDPFGIIDTWMAFYSLDDYKAGRVQYADAFSIASVSHYWTSTCKTRQRAPFS